MNTSGKPPAGDEDSGESAPGPEVPSPTARTHQIQLTMEAPEELTAEDLAARAQVGFALDLEPVLPGPAVGSEKLLLDVSPASAHALGVHSPWEPPQVPQVPSAPEPIPMPQGPSRPVSAPPRARSGRRYPKAWAWAGLGPAPTLEGARPGVERPLLALPSPPAGLDSANEILELAAMGKAPDGVMEMHLIFKEDVLRGITCTLRLMPDGMRALFVAPDETVRRYLEGTAEDLVGRMRRRGLRVAGWSVEVAAG